MFVQTSTFSFCILICKWCCSYCWGRR